ncbi:PorV/PorQ family protein [candidate division KSB1 bacterium]|nr:PorV/PorQ family protein [candidate division KSB1 bacterium]
MIKRFQHILIIMCLISGLTLSFLFAGAESEQSAYVDVLRIGVDSRALGMAGAATGLTGSPMGVNWNPALIQSMKNTEIAFMYNHYIKNISYEYGTISSRVSDGWAFALSFMSCHTGTWAETLYSPADETDSLTGVPAAYFVPAISLAMQVQRNIQFGINMKPIFKSVEGVLGQTIATDLGFLYAKNNIGFGISIRNIGPYLKYQERTFSLPPIYSTGVSYNFPGKATIAVDLEKPLDQDLIAKTGFEYHLDNGVSIRSGGILSSLETKVWGAPGLALGIGFRKKNLKLNYAANFIGFSGASHSLSVGYAFIDVEPTPRMRDMDRYENRGNSNDENGGGPMLPKKKARSCLKIRITTKNLYRKSYSLSVT